MKHTPGPWSINEWTQPDREISIGAVGTPLIAKAMLRDCSINEQKANAKLIAAAPDMLEALLSVNKYFVDLQNKCALTHSDERAWKQVSKIINQIEK